MDMILNDAHNQLQCTQAELADRLSDLRGQLRPRWTATALVILHLKNSVSWPFEGAKHFTEWVSMHSREYGIGESTLRSYVLVAEYYINDLSTKFAKWGMTPVPFAELPDCVGPEMLVDLKKIAKVGSVEAEEHFAKLIMSGNCRYVDIRNAWLTYRKTFMTGLPRRGRMTKSDLESPRESGALLERKFSDILLTQNGFYSRQGELLECTVIQNTSAFLPRNMQPDFILAVKDDEKVLCLHGVEVKGFINKRMGDHLPQWAKYFDKIWLALPHPVQETDLKSMPGDIGILEVKDQELRVLRDAGTSKLVGKSVDLLLRSMLAKKVL